MEGWVPDPQGPGESEVLAIWLLLDYRFNEFYVEYKNKNTKYNGPIKNRLDPINYIINNVGAWFFFNV